MEEFLALHPEHADADEVALTIARIDHEHAERLALEEQRQGLLKKKQGLIADNKKRKDKLADLDKDLEKFIDVRLYPESAYCVLIFSRLPNLSKRPSRLKSDPLLQTSRHQDLIKFSTPGGSTQYLDSRLAATSKDSMICVSEHSQRPLSYRKYGKPRMYDCMCPCHRDGANYKAWTHASRDAIYWQFWSYEIV